MMQIGGYAKGVIQMTTSSLMFSIMAALIAYARHIDFYTTAFYRFLVGAFVIGTLALFRRIKLEHDSHRISSRLVDLICPIGHGQRGLIVSPPKAGKTMLLKELAGAITTTTRTSC